MTAGAVVYVVDDDASVRKSLARLIAAISRAKRNQKLAALIIIDLDGFRQFRDEIGRASCRERE